MNSFASIGEMGTLQKRGWAESQLRNELESRFEAVEAIFLEPASGIEPPTCRLRNRPEQILKCSVYQMVSPF